MYTDSSRSNEENCYINKFLDDTTLVTLLQGHKQDHGHALSNFVHWCDENFLKLNVRQKR